VAAACRAADDAEQRPDGKREPRFEPGLQLAPSPGVHADLAAAVALAAPHQQRAAAWVEVGLGESERLVDAQPGTPEDHDQAAQPNPVRVVTGGAHDGDDLLDLGRIGRIPHALVARRTAGVESRHRRR
jgi:hypothetical protein